MFIEEKLLRVLGKIYRHVTFHELQHYDYDLEKKITTYRLPAQLTAREQVLLVGSGWPINRMVHHHHDDALGQLKGFLATEGLRNKVSEFFIVALAKGLHRGLQPLLSYYHALHLPDHSWTAFDFKAFKHTSLGYEPHEVPCAVCGLRRDKYDNQSETRFDMAQGRCRTSFSFDHVTDLEDAVAATSVELEPAHVQVLVELLKAVDQAPSDETGSSLEKRVSKLRLLPGSNLASRLWALRALAELGVISNGAIPNYSAARHFYAFTQRMEWEVVMHRQFKTRADPVWPLSVWRGGMSVDWDLALEIFPQMVSHRLNDPPLRRG